MCANFRPIRPNQAKLLNLLPTPMNSGFSDNLYPLSDSPLIFAVNQEIDGNPLSLELIPK